VRQFPDLRAPLSDGVVSLRRFVLDDVADVTRACQDLEIVRWTASIPIPYAESDAQGWIERHPENWRTGIAASFAIVDATDGAFMGNINVIVPPDAAGRAALGYWVAEWGRMRGFATHSLILASEWVFDALEPRELYLETLEGNVASERVAAKAGYAFSEFRSEDYIRSASRGTPGRVRVKHWILRPN
jgi:RimJ/RimL family protein N-acetyltransferase